jgi:hypothetical protein
VSTVYNGNGTLVTPTQNPVTRIPISVVANTTPIEITTGGAHGFNTGDTIEQEGTSVSSANGQFQITVVDSTHYRLNGTVADGGGSGGYAVDYECQPAIIIPANGDLADMGPIGAAMEGLANPVPFLYRRTGQLRLVNEYIFGNDWFITPFITNPWSTNTNFNSSVVTPLSMTSYSMQSAQVNNLGIAPNFQSGDWLELSTSFTVSTFAHAPNSYGWIQVGFGLTQGGSLLSTIGVSSSLCGFQTQGSSFGPSNMTTAVTCQLFTPINNGGGGLSLPASNLGFCIFGRMDYNNGGAQVDLYLVGEWTGFIRQYRQN